MTNLVERSTLSPGQMFRWWRWLELSGGDVVLVVLDGKLEVDFWRGGLWAVGDVAPGALVEVLS